MRASSQFILRNIADEYLLIPVGEAAMRIQGLIAMSESGAMFFNKLKKGCTKSDLVSALMAEYEVSESVATEDTDAFLHQMRYFQAILEE
jgi:hypothetical protein